MPSHQSAYRQFYGTETVLIKVLCVRAIEHWMAANRLRLNPEKTELIWIGAKQSLLKIPGGGLPLMVS